MTSARRRPGRAATHPTTPGAPQSRPWSPPRSWRRIYPQPATAAPDDEPGPDGFSAGWTPGLLVLLWPELFTGDEMPDQKQVEVTVMAMADAGLIDLYAVRGWRAWRGQLRIVVRDPAAPLAPELDGDAPWVWQAILEEAGRSRHGRYGARLFHLRPQTRRAALARSIVVAGRPDRFLPREESPDPEVVRESEAAARGMARRWTAFVQSHPGVHRRLRDATSLPDAVV